LGLLPERQRMVVEMVKLREMSLDDAADESRLSVPAIKSLLHRAYTKLKDVGRQTDA
jgi:RNA polymerase sigma-70 factor (ECF subfamily)